MAATPEALLAHLAPLLQPPRPAATAAAEDSLADAVAGAGIVVRRIDAAVLHPLRDVVGAQTFLLAAADVPDTGAPEDAAEQEPVPVLRLTVGAPHPALAGFAPLAKAAAAPEAAAAAYTRATAGMVPLPTARTMLSLYAAADGAGRPPLYVLTHLPSDANAPQYLGWECATVPQPATAKGQPSGAQEVTRTVDIVMNGEISKGAPVDVLLGLPHVPPLARPLRVRSDFEQMARYELAGTTPVRPGLAPAASVWLTACWKGPLPEAVPAPPPTSATVTVTTRLMPYAKDPEAYQALRPLRLELEALQAIHAAWRQRVAAAAAEAADAPTEAIALPGPGLAAAGHVDALFGGTAAAAATDAALLMVGNLAPREDLDFVERLWLVAKDAASEAEVQALLSRVFDDLEAGTLKPMLHRANTSSLAALIRDAMKLWRNPSAPDFAEQREIIMRACDHWHANALECLVEAGLGKLQRDYSHYLVGGEMLDWAQVNEFLAAAGAEPEALLERLAVLHRVCELYVFVRQAVLGIPLEWLRALLRAALDAFKTQRAALDATLELAMPLPKFAASTASVLSGIAQTLDPIEWMLAYPHAPAADGAEAAAPLEQTVVRLSRAADLVMLPLGQGMDVDGGDADARADAGLGDDLLTIRRYAVAVGRADDQRWHSENVL